MKFNLFLFFLLSLFFAYSQNGFSKSLLSVATEDPREGLIWDDSSTDSQLNSLLTAIAAFDKAWANNEPHKAASSLEWGVERCSILFSKANLNHSELNFSRAVYACLILESEWLNRVSPWGGFKSSERIHRYFELTSNVEISSSERLYAEGRIYSALPPLYGQDFKKALVALEMLRRLESNPILSVPWIEKIRKMQGKEFAPSSIETPAAVSEWNRKETDGFPLEILPVMYAGFPQGVGLQLKVQDSALGDKARRLQGRVFATHRGSLGVEGRYEDIATLEAAKLGAKFQYLHGIQEYHGLGIDSPKESSDLYLDKGTVEVYSQKNIVDRLYLKLGWRVHSSHLRKVEGGEVPHVEAISNSFDSGLISEIGYDTRDSEYEPYRGQRIFVQGYFPRINAGSSRSFDRLLAVGESYWPLSSKTFLKIYGAISSVSDSAPFDWYSQLSGTVPFSGIRPTRFVDRTLVAMGTELRLKKWQPLTLVAYSNVGNVATSTADLFSRSLKVGYGLGGEIHLTRFRNRAFRAEFGRFGGEWGFNSMLGIALD